MKYFTLLLGSSAMLLSACGGGGGGLAEDPIVPGLNNSPPVYKSISLDVNQGSPEPRQKSSPFQEPLLITVQ